MSHSFRRTVSFAAALVMLAGVAGTASAETTWQRNHPRRAQVNHRLADQSRRIHNDVRNGTMTHRQAAFVRHEDHQIRQEEHDMARQDGGHITRPEQKVLDRQENRISRQIPPS
jgi:hypothetical protein